MKNKKLQTLFDLVRELHIEEQKKSGMISPIPYSFAKETKSGAMLVFSPSIETSEEIERRIKSIV